MSEPLLRVTRPAASSSSSRAACCARSTARRSTSHPGEALGLVGESGSGKTMALRALVGLLPRAARITGGSVEIDGVDVTAVERGPRGASCAAARSSMIFQEPMTALNPVMRVGEQIAEGPLVRLGLQSRREAQRARARADAPRRHPRSGAPRRGVSARALGRDAPARDDRDRALGRPEADPLRRADDGARRDDPGPDPEAARSRCSERARRQRSSSCRTTSR